MASTLGAQWIVAAKILAVNPEAKVICPKCTRGVLGILDQKLDSDVLERHLSCPKCGAYNSMRMKQQSTFIEEQPKSTLRDDGLHPADS